MSEPAGENESFVEPPPAKGIVAAGAARAMSSDRSNWSLARIVASRYESKTIHYYVKWKIRLDPVYAAVASRLEGENRPLLDIGCGVGVLAFYLREYGWSAPIDGIDLDEEKLSYGIEVAARHYEGVAFRSERVEQIDHIAGDVALLDVVHYMEKAKRERLLSSIAERMDPGARLLMRTTLSDGGWRAWVTRLAERLAGVLGWMRMSTVEFPTRVELDAIFDEERFSRSATPLWGRTPFNSFLLEYRRL